MRYFWITKLVKNELTELFLLCFLQLIQYSWLLTPPFAMYNDNGAAMQTKHVDARV